MCGVTVFYNFPELENEIKYLFSKINNRGPDKQTYKRFNEINFLFSRLSIQDLTDSGDQPILSNSKKFLMLFNGEIYNHHFLRKKINDERNFNNWNGNSDSETLVESFNFFGIEKTLGLIRGMYAIILYEFSSNKFYFINDIFGEKPLYYYFNKKSFLASSSIDSFTKINDEINHNSIKELVSNNYINHPNTIFKNVFKIKPATIITFRINEKGNISNISNKTYYDKTKKLRINNLSLDKTLDNFEKTLFDSVEKQLISDVPLGSFLSGGIDSTLISAIASKIYPNKLSTFTIGFEDTNFDESVYAKKIAEHLGTNHFEKYLNKENLLNTFDDVFEAYGEPFSDSSQIPTILLSKFCSENVKVALTGDGGDELFGGYNRYVFNIRLWGLINIFPMQLRKLLSKFMLYGSDNKMIFKFLTNILFFFNPRFKKIHYFDQKLLQLFRAINSKNLFDFTHKLKTHIYDHGKKNLFRNRSEFFEDYSFDKYYGENTEGLMMDDINNYLPGDLLVKVDRAAMHFGLETRAPFLDKKVFEFSKTLPMELKINNGNQKIILKKLLQKFVPKDLTERPKQGFLIPVNEILNNKDMINKIDLLFDKKKVNDQNILNYEFISDLWEKFKKGYHFDQYLIWDLIVLQKWLDKYFLSSRN